MKGMLAGLGIAGLLCLPCLLIGGVVSLAFIGVTLSAVATNPLVQVVGLVLAGVAAVMFWRAHRRAACEIHGPRPGERDATAGIADAGPRSR